MFKSKIKKTIVISSVVTVLAMSGLYVYAIQGEKLDEKDAWIKDIKMPIAHRGFDNGDIPENSLKSFKEAIKRKYSIELDVQYLEKDGTLIVFHDTNLERLTGDKRDLKDVTYNDIKDLKLEGTEETIPTLQEVLDLVDNQVPLLIEIKNGKNAKELAKKTNEELKDYNGRYAIQSFDPFILNWFKTESPNTARIQLSCDFKGEQNAHLKWYEKFVLKNMITNFKSRPHVIAYDIDAIDNLPVKLLKGNYPIISWTIDDEESMKLGLEKSDNIIFDNVTP